MLKGKIALVTGASRGIGRAIAIDLAKQGATVVVNYAGNEQKANEVVDEIKELGSEAIAVRANVADAEEVTNLIKQTVDTFGQIDILVNNAGVTRDNLLMRMKEEEWDTVIDTNRQTLENGTANGFVMHEPTVEALIDAMTRGIDVYRQQKSWSKLVRTGMQQDLGWEKSALDYLSLYRSLD